MNAAFLFLRNLSVINRWGRRLHLLGSMRAGWLLGEVNCITSFCDHILHTIFLAWIFSIIFSLSSSSWKLLALRQNPVAENCTTFDFFFPPWSHAAQSPPPDADRSFLLSPAMAERGRFRQANPTSACPPRETCFPSSAVIEWEGMPRLVLPS